MPKVGEILVQMGACTATHVQEALQNQVIFGGRLGTNLLELGHVRELDLAKALGQRHRLPALFGDIKVPPAVTALVSSELVDRYEVVPYQLQERRLFTLVVDPGNLQSLDEVAFATSKIVQPIVVPEARMWVLMGSLYGVERQLRGIEVDFGKMGAPQGVLHEQPKPAASAGQAAGDLMDEAEFDAMYAGRGFGSTPSSPAIPAAQPAPPPKPMPAPAAAKPAPQPAAVAPPREPSEEVVLDLTDELPAAAVIAAEEPKPAIDHEVLRLMAEIRRTGGPPPMASARPPPAARPAPAPPPPPLPEPTPLDFAGAVKALLGVADRDAIAVTVLRYARSRFKRALLLTVQKGQARGWEGLGEGLTAPAVKRIAVKLGTPGVLETCVETRAHFLGPFQKTEGNIRFLRALGGGAPKNAFLIPILVQGRVVNVLYADNGRGGLVDADLGELLILATKIAKSYDALLSKAAWTA